MRKTNPNARHYSGSHVLQLIATAAESAYHVSAGQLVPEIVLEAAATGVESGMDCPIRIASNDEADDMTIGVPVAERSGGSGSQFHHRKVHYLLGFDFGAALAREYDASVMLQIRSRRSKTPLPILLLSLLCVRMRGWSFAKAG
jgi:hypothetical protein